MNRSRSSFLKVIAIAFFICLAGAGAVVAASVRGASPEQPTATPWSTYTQLNEARAVFGLAAASGQVFALGGQTENDAILSSVLRSVVSKENAPWLEQSAPLPSPLFLHGAVSLGTQVYVVGGWNGSATVPTSYSAQATTEGISHWDQTSSLPGARSAFALTAYATGATTGNVYALGGWDGFQPTRSVFRARANGSDLVWEQIGPELPELLYRHAAVTVSTAKGRSIYLLGGFNGAQRTNKVWRAAVANDGSLGAWTPAPPLLAERDFLAAAVYRGYVVVTGGRNTSGQSEDTVWAAKINDDGSLGAWSDTILPLLPAPLDRHAMTVVSTAECGEMLLVAGGRSNGVYQRKTYRSECTAATPTPTATPTGTPTLTPTPSPSLTPSVPWARWADNRPIYVRPNATASVALLYGSFKEPRLEAELNSDRVYFPQSNSSDIKVPLSTVESSYALRVAAIARATPGEVILRAKVGQVFLEDKKVVVISRSVHLPLVLKPKPSPAPFPTPRPEQRQISGKVARADSGLGGAPGESYQNAVLKLFDTANDACESLSSTPKATAATDENGMYYFNVEKEAFCVYSEPPVASVECDLAAGHTNPRYVPLGSEAVNVDFLWQCASPQGR